VKPDDRFCWSCGTELAQAPDEVRRPVPQPKGDWGMDPKMALVMRRAYLAEQRGRLDEAERLVREVLDADRDSVPALSMLAGILRRKGDLVGSVAAAQRVSEAAGAGSPPGAVDRAREDRAKVQDQVVRELQGSFAAAESPMGAFASPGVGWYRSRQLYLALAAMGMVSFFLALIAIFRGELTGYVWFGVSLFAAGWCYNDAESRRQAGLFWAPFVLGLGPFGLAIYLLATH
jgi:hypothetical protein